MYRLTTLILAMLLTCSLSAQQLYVGTYNIRYDNPNDRKEGNAWAQRCPQLCDFINFEQPAVFGTQEVLATQLHDLLQGLEGYAYIGVGRDDGREEGEYAAIFYRKDLLKLLDSGNFWLSQTPDRPSLGWDAACIRICTWGKFEDKTTGKQFYFFNTHMDHVGTVARRESTRLILQRIGQLAKSQPTILTGDFNVDQTDEIYGIFSRSGILPMPDSAWHPPVRGTTLCRTAAAMPASTTSSSLPISTFSITLSSPTATGSASHAATSPTIIPSW